MAHKGESMCVKGVRGEGGKAAGKEGGGRQGMG